jgi:hypothetical protein
VLGSLFFFFCRGSKVLFERWQSIHHLKTLTRQFSRYVESEGQKEQGLSGKHSSGLPMASWQKFEAHLLNLENNLMSSPGADYFNINVVQTLKRLIFLRRTYEPFLKTRTEKEKKIAWQYRKRTEELLNFALRRAPAYTELSRIYGMTLWVNLLHAEEKSEKIVSMGSRTLSLFQAREEALAWIRHAIVKGSQDYYLVKSLFSHEKMRPLLDALKEDFKDHIINNPYFTRRLLAGARIQDSLRKAWLLWRLYFWPLNDFSDVMKIEEQHMRSLTASKRWEWAHLNALILLSRKETLGLELMTILEGGGPTEPERRQIYLNMKEGSQAWFLEQCRSLIFGDSFKSLKKFQQIQAKHPENPAYRDILRLMNNYLKKNSNSHFK